MFMTSATFAGNFGGVAVGDAACEAAAATAGLNGTYKAWLADSSSSPAARFTRGQVPYVNIKGVQVAPDWNGLFAPVPYAPLLTAAGASPVPSECRNPPMSTAFWSGASSEMITRSTCGDWTSARPGYDTGSVISQDPATGNLTNWTGGTFDCTCHWPFLCVEQ
jgi:hypothetical protein